MQTSLQNLTQATCYLQVEQLLVCGGCPPVGCAAPVAFEQLFFNVTAASLVCVQIGVPAGLLHAPALCSVNSTDGSNR